MARIVDTSVCIAIERRRQVADDLATVSAGESIAIASITAAELLIGAELSRDLEHQRWTRNAVEYFIQRLDVLPFDLGAARVYARLLAELRNTGYSVGGFDLLIASTALANDCSVVTLNLREFNRIPGLNVISPDW